MVIDVKLTKLGDNYFSAYTYIKSLCYTHKLKQFNVTCQLYISKKERKFYNFKRSTMRSIVYMLQWTAY